MKVTKLGVLLTVIVVDSSLAQIVEVRPPCRPIPHAVVSYGDVKCSIQTTDSHLSLKIDNSQYTDVIFDIVTNTMVDSGFVHLSHNTYWLPDNRSCYFTWYGVGTNNLVLVPSIPFLGLRGTYCGLDLVRYNSELFGSEIYRALEQNALLDYVTVRFSSIEVGTAIFEEILADGGTPGLMKISDGELITIDMQY